MIAGNKHLKSILSHFNHAPDKIITEAQKTEI